MGLELMEHKREEYGYSPTPWAQGADLTVRALRQWAFGNAGNYNLNDYVAPMTQRERIEYRINNPIRLAEPVQPRLHGPLKSDGTY